jgi:hypothetical protein
LLHFFAGFSGFGRAEHLCSPLLVINTSFIYRTTERFLENQIINTNKMRVKERKSNANGKERSQKTHDKVLVISKGKGKS